MKRILVLGSFLIISSILQSCNGKKTEAPATPEAVITAFNAKYPGSTDVTWEKEDENGTTIYEGNFKSGGKKIKAEFDENGNFLKEK